MENDKIKRCSLELTKYNYVVGCSLGKNNIVADALLRQICGAMALIILASGEYVIDPLLPKPGRFPSRTAVQ